MSRYEVVDRTSVRDDRGESYRLELAIDGVAFYSNPLADETGGTLMYRTDVDGNPVELVSDNFLAFDDFCRRCEDLASGATEPERAAFLGESARACVRELAAPGHRPESRPLESLFPEGVPEWLADVPGGVPHVDPPRAGEEGIKGYEAQWVYACEHSVADIERAEERHGVSVRDELAKDYLLTYELDPDLMGTFEDAGIVGADLVSVVTLAAYDHVDADLALMSESFSARSREVNPTELLERAAGMGPGLGAPELETSPSEGYWAWLGAEDGELRLVGIHESWDNAGEEEVPEACLPLDGSVMRFDQEKGAFAEEAGGLMTGYASCEEFARGFLRLDVGSPEAVPIAEDVFYSLAFDDCPSVEAVGALVSTVAERLPSLSPDDYLPAGLLALEGAPARMAGLAESRGMATAKEAPTPRRAPSVGR